MSLQRLLESQIVLDVIFFCFRAYASKLAWADRTFSDCLAVLIAYKTWWRHKTSGYFQRAHGGERDLEGKWCYQRYLQKN